MDTTETLPETNLERRRTIVSDATLEQCVHVAKRIENKRDEHVAHIQKLGRDLREDFHIFAISTALRHNGDEKYAATIEAATNALTHTLEEARSLRATNGQLEITASAHTPHQHRSYAKISIGGIRPNSDPIRMILVNAAESPEADRFWMEREYHYNRTGPLTPCEARELERIMHAHYAEQPSVQGLVDRMQRRYSEPHETIVPRHRI